MNTGMQRQGNPVPQQAVDVGGCGTQNTGYATGPGPYTQLAQPGQIYAIYFQLGFCGAIDDLGRFYAVSVQRTPEGTPSIWYEDLGPQLAFEIGFGYFNICGVNVTAGEDVCASVFQNNSNLPNIAGNVDLSIWSTDGCWCPFEECISAANDSSLVLEAAVVPNKDAPTQMINVVGEGENARNVYLSDLRLAFVGTLFRTVEGCQTVGVFAGLDQAANPGMPLPAASPCYGPAGAMGYAPAAAPMAAPMANPGYY